MTNGATGHPSPAVRRQFEGGGGDGAGVRDPLEEERHSPVPGLIQRYPDRALVLVTDRCFVACGFCNRRFFVGTAGDEASPLKPDVPAALDHLDRSPAVREVILSGGDPLVLPDSELRTILERLRAVPHVELIRVGTRAPMGRPDRITSETAAMLARHRPLVVAVHFNHPDELTAASLEACARLVDAGLPVLNQAVLLRGVNDDPETLSSLFWKLTLRGVRPYYLFQCDRVKGTSRFWVPLHRGIEIVKVLRESLPGHAMPHFSVDLPGREGKVWIDPSNPPDRVEGGYLLRGRHVRMFYPDAP
jgi:lysine 2,3-aminomutase